MKYFVQETITVTYKVNADSFDEALDKARELDRDQAMDECNEGFTYVYCPEEGSDLAL